QVAVKATPLEWLVMYFENHHLLGEEISDQTTLMHVKVLDVMVLVAETGQYASSLLAAATLFLYGYLDSGEKNKTVTLIVHLLIEFISQTPSVWQLVMS
ncbi:hypothetical protein HDU80_002378, partial [Chytriomyces hyalinus]